MSDFQQILEGEHSELLDSITDGYWVLNIENDKLVPEEYLSPAFKAQFGYEDHEIPNTNDGWLKIIHKDDAKRALDQFFRHIHDGDPYRLVVRYHHKDGSTIWILCRGCAVKDSEGRWSKMLGTHTNITTLKNTSENYDRLCVVLRELQFDKINSLLDGV